ncbi:MAG TPA: DUF3291 domain-containing protein [Streptosporangiaceae bacterium]|nr:DUF3291 domain-containing protein [Streptosporangiaceae bacterium]
MDYHLAQVNIGRMRAPLDSPEMAGFVAALEPVNALADAAPGFIWRLQTEDGNATGVRAFEWDAAGSAGVLVNMSVWESVEALAAYVYSGAHRAVLARRREWFELVRESQTALWWVPAGVRPGTADAEERIRRLRAHGPTPAAFTLREHFPPGASPDRSGAGRGRAKLEVDLDAAVAVAGERSGREQAGRVGQRQQPAKPRGGRDQVQHAAGRGGLPLPAQDLAEAGAVAEAEGAQVQDQVAARLRQRV